MTSRDLTPEQAADDLAFRLAAFRMAKHGAHWLRMRVELLHDEGRDWWACDSRAVVRRDEPQQRLPLGRTRA